MTRFEALRGQPQAQRRHEREEFRRELEKLEATAGEYPLEDGLTDHLHDNPPGTPGWDAARYFLQQRQGRPAEVPEKYRMTFSEAAKGYLEEQRRDPKAKLTAQTLGQYEAVYRLFAEYCRDEPLDRISKGTATKFLGDVSRLAPTWGRSPHTKALSVWVLLDKHGNGREGLSNRTLNRYASCLAAVFKRAERRGYWSGSNPFAGQARKIASHRKAGWLPFSDDEVLTVLKATAGLPQQDARRWVPLIGAYSGMRSNEICSLTTNDIREEGGISYFDVTRAKTRPASAAFRSTPR